MISWCSWIFSSWAIWHRSVRKYKRFRSRQICHSDVWCIDMRIKISIERGSAHFSAYILSCIAIAYSNSNINSSNSSSQMINLCCLIPFSGFSSSFVWQHCCFIYISTNFTGLKVLLCSLWLPKNSWMLYSRPTNELPILFIYYLDTLAPLIFIITSPSALYSFWWYSPHSP